MNLCMRLFMESVTQIQLNMMKYILITLVYEMHVNSKFKTKKSHEPGTRLFF